MLGPLLQAVEATVMVLVRALWLLLLVMQPLLPLVLTLLLLLLLLLVLVLLLLELVVVLVMLLVWPCLPMQVSLRQHQRLHPLPQQASRPATSPEPQRPHPWLE